MAEVLIMACGLPGAAGRQVGTNLCAVCVG